MNRYIGLDVHASSCTAAIIDGRGKHLGSQVIETNGKSLVEFLKIQPGCVHLCLEEVTQSAWLAEILTPHVSEVVVTIPKKKRGQKNDVLDAFALAEQLRRGAIDVKVYKQQGPFGELRQLVKTHATVVTDVRRVQSRLKALYRSRGVPTPGADVYRPSSRDSWLSRLPQSSRRSAELLYLEYLRQLEQGTKPNLSKVTLARKLASISLSMWKNEEEYDPKKREIMSS